MQPVNVTNLLARLMTLMHPNITQVGQTRPNNIGEGGLVANNNPVNQRVNHNLKKELNYPDLNSLKMNSINRSQNVNYLKEVMNLPRDMKDVLVLLQNNTKNVQTQSGLMLANINIKDLTDLIQKSGKDALKQIITTMSQSSAKGLTDTSQIQDAMNYINASVSVQDAQTVALKNFMLLYLPWLPLQEGVDFELEFTFSEGGDEEDENILNISIVTKNFGQIKILIILKTICSFEIFIQCSISFPKQKLMKMVEVDEKKHSMKSNMVFENAENKIPKLNTQQAQITLANVKEISPFLLLIANSVIKNTLIIDNEVQEA